MKSRKNFILDVHYGLVDVEESSWVEIEDKYLYDLIGKKGDQARKHYKWYITKGKEKGEWKPGSKIDETESDRLTLRARWQAQTKDGIKWLESYRNNITRQDIIDLKRDIIKDISTFSPNKLRIQYPKNRTITYVISLPDLHFGKQKLEETIENFDTCFFDLVSRVNNVKQYILPIGNDLFHSEGMRNTTTKGTKMFDFTEWKRCFREVWKLMAERILFLSECAPVYVPIVQGNHDWERTFYLGDVLAAYFKNNENVIVDNSMEPQKYFQFGKTLLGWDHGDCMKPLEYPLEMATSRPTDFAKSNSRIMFTGHLHSQQGYEIKGVIVRFLPSICPSDEWHKRYGFKANKAAQAYKFDDEGIIGYEESRL